MLLISWYTFKFLILIIFLLPRDLFRLDLLAVNFLSLCLSERVYFPSLSKAIEFHWIQNYGLTVIFSFNTLKMSLCCLLACMVSDEKSAVVHILLPLLVRCFIFLWLPWRFSLCLCFFWVMVCLGIYVHFLCVFLNLFCLVFSELLGSLIWCLSLILENFWPFLQIFFSVLFFWYSIYAYIIWFGIVSSSWMFRPALFTVFSLCFSLFNFYCTIFNITNFFCFIMSSLLMSLTKGILHTFCFWFLEFLFESLLLHPSLCWSCMLSTFSTRAFNIWIVVILNALADS